MESRLFFSTEEVTPSREAALDLQGIPLRAKTSEKAEAALREAFALYTRLAEPVGKIRRIDRTAFAAVFAGEGRNEEGAPLGAIYNAATGLALFAVTLGAAICRAIDDRFRSSDFALGSLLDSVASAGADKAAGVLEDRFHQALAGDGEVGEGDRTLGYSPGYCGWHIGAQKKLFDRLGPEEIGIRLGESFLMEPIKSVSGVLVAGPAAIHRFRPAFPFCRGCTTHPCRRRMDDL